MTWYRYDGLPAYDADGGFARNAAGQVFARDDIEHTTPLNVRTWEGVPFPANTITTNDDGFITDFEVEDHLDAVWVSGPYVIGLLSYTGVLERVDQAKTYAQESALAAAQAAAAAEEAAAGGGGGASSLDQLSGVGTAGKAVAAAETQAQVQAAAGITTLGFEVGAGLKVAQVGDVVTLDVADRLLAPALDARYVDEDVYAQILARVAALELANGASPGTSFASATFTAPDGTNIRDYTSETGTQFALIPGLSDTADLIIRAGKVYSPDHLSTFFTASNVPPTPDYTVEATVEIKTLVADTNAGVYARWTGTGLNCYVLRFVTDNNAWRLAKLIDGVGTLLGSSANTIPVGGTALLSLTVDGDIVRASLDGQQIIQVTDATYATGGCGITAIGVHGPGTGLHLDNFRAVTV